MCLHTLYSKLNTYTQYIYIVVNRNNEQIIIFVYSLYIGSRVIKRGKRVTIYNAFSFLHTNSEIMEEYFCCLLCR